jgi:hypothetical protein
MSAQTRNRINCTEIGYRIICMLSRQIDIKPKLGRADLYWSTK